MEASQSSGNASIQKNISFMRSLCMGQIEEDVIVPFPKIPEGEAETLKSVIGTLESWLKGKDADYRKWDRQGEMPPEFLQEMREMGLFSLIIPEDFGGLGFHASAYSRMLQELSKYDGSVAITAGAHSSIGMRGLLLFGTPEQKAKYLPDLASGKMIAAFCLTEPGAGSDAASIKTKAVKDGNDASALKKALDELQAELSKIGEAMYKGAAQNSSTAGQQDSKKDDGPIEGEVQK